MINNPSSNLILIGCILNCGNSSPFKLLFDRNPQTNLIKTSVFFEVKSLSIQNEFQKYLEICYPKLEKTTLTNNSLITNSVSSEVELDKIESFLYSASYDFGDRELDLFEDKPNRNYKITLTSSHQQPRRTIFIRKISMCNLIEFIDIISCDKLELKIYKEICEFLIYKNTEVLSKNEMLFLYKKYVFFTSLTNEKKINKTIEKITYSDNVQ